MQLYVCCTWIATELINIPQFNRTEPSECGKSDWPAAVSAQASISQHLPFHIHRSPDISDLVVILSLLVAVFPAYMKSMKLNTVTWSWNEALISAHNNLYLQSRCKFIQCNSKASEIVSSGKLRWFASFPQQMGLRKLFRSLAFPKAITHYIVHAFIPLSK